MRHLTPTAVILDLGAGAGIVQQMNFRGLAARVCGVDLDPRVVDNPLLDEGKIADAGGFTVERLDRIEGRPEYLRMTWPTDLLGAAYERLVNAWDGLAMFRVLRVGELRKG